MKKNLYSLTLSDDVVREVDALAHRMGTNRSALVNQIWPSTSPCRRPSAAGTIFSRPSKS